MLLLAYIYVYHRNLYTIYTFYNVFYLYSLYFRKDMSLRKISNLLNIDFKICLMHDNSEFIYNQWLWYRKFLECIYSSISLRDWKINHFLWNPRYANILRNRGSPMLHVSILRQRTSSLFAILRSSFFLLLAPFLFSSLLGFRYAPRTRNRVETHHESGPME